MFGFPTRDRPLYAGQPREEASDAVATSRSLDQAVTSLGHVAEGVYSARTVMQRARALGVDMPITEAVLDVLEARMLPREAMGRLMTRQSRAET